MTSPLREREFEFVRDWNSYMDVRLMAKKYDVHPRTIYENAKRLGLSPRLYRKKK